MSEEVPCESGAWLARYYLRQVHSKIYAKHKCNQSLITTINKFINQLPKKLISNQMLRAASFQRSFSPYFENNYRNRSSSSSPYHRSAFDRTSNRSSTTTTREPAATPTLSPESSTPILPHQSGTTVVSRTPRQRTAAPLAQPTTTTAIN